MLSLLSSSPLLVCGVMRGDLQHQGMRALEVMPARGHGVAWRRGAPQTSHQQSVATGGGVGIVENGLRRGISSDIELVCRGHCAAARGVKRETSVNSELHQRRRSCHIRRVNNTGIGGASSSFKICSFESAEPRNNCIHRRAQLFKKRQHPLTNVLNVSASRQRSLRRTAAWDGGVRNRRPRTLPCHCRLSSTLPVEKKVEGTE